MLKRPILMAALGFCVLFACSLYASYEFDTSGFIEPDTCWILALGKNIWENRAVPSADPFSFTLPLSAAVGAPQPFVVHQWLFDVTVYALYRCGKLIAIASFCAALATAAFVALPWRLCLRANASPIFVYAITACTGLSIAFRPYVRPEIASCLCLALWLALLQQLRMQVELISAPDSKGQQQSEQQAKFSWRIVLAFASLMVLWCNLHTGFLAGLVLMTVYALSFVLQDISEKRKIAGPTITSLVALIASGAATLINPVGIKLWQFLPVLFGLGRYFTIQEMLPVQLKDVGDASYAPFFLLLLISLCSIIYYLQRRSLFQVPLYFPVRLVSIFMIFISAFAAIRVGRLIPFAILIVAIESATLFSRSKPGCQREFWGRSPLFLMLTVSSDRRQIFSTIDKLWDALLIVAAAVFVPLFASRVQTPMLPQWSASFPPPFRAIQHLMKHPQSGPLFNEALIGSMMTWYLPGVKVFVDSRFDQYGEAILTDYQNILCLRRGAFTVLDTYGIEWIFVARSQPLATVLQKVPTWKIIYEDEDALIFRRAVNESAQKKTSGPE